MAILSSPVSKERALESYAQSMYATGIANKSHRVYNVAKVVCGEVAHLSDSCFPRLYVQIQRAFTTSSASNPFASVPDLFESSQQCSDSFFNLDYLWNSCKETTQIINAHPLMHTIRRVCLGKQLLDMSIASVEWLAGKRDNNSMTHTAINTTLVCAPLLLPVGIISNTFLLGCLAYSIKQDFSLSADREKRESSPSVALVRDTIYPKVKSIFSKIWG